MAFALGEEVLPYYLRSRSVRIVDPSIVLRSIAAPDLEVTLNGTSIGASSWSPWPLLTALQAAPLSGAFGGGLVGEHTLTIQSWGTTEPPDDFDILLVMDLAEG